MSMEAEVTRARCVGLLSQAIEVATKGGKRSITITELASIMSHMMRLELPDGERRIPMRIVERQPIVVEESGHGTD